MDPETIYSFGEVMDMVILPLTWIYQFSSYFHTAAYSPYRLHNLTCRIDRRNLNLQRANYKLIIIFWMTSFNKLYKEKLIISSLPKRKVISILNTTFLSFFEKLNFELTQGNVSLHKRLNCWCFVY